MFLIEVDGGEQAASVEDLVLVIGHSADGVEDSCKAVCRRNYNVAITMCTCGNLHRAAEQSRNMFYDLKIHVSNSPLHYGHPKPSLDDESCR